MKVAPGIFQYTAIDDCTRFRVLGLYKRRTAANTLLFIERVMEEMPFPIQRFQTDRGGEFFAIKVQKFLLKQSIKFRPIKPVPIPMIPTGKSGASRPGNPDQVVH